MDEHFNAALRKEIIEATPDERSQARDPIDALDPAPAYFTDAEKSLITERAAGLDEGRHVGRPWRESLAALRSSLA
ncbi:MAG: hypothetical protein LBN10_02785 [Propionibacteriaceae bacterium]|jgi:hypothetical protein|nr:hypothetical protein [Propionibacteriaceae bacterium]